MKNGNFKKDILIPVFIFFLLIGALVFVWKLHEHQKIQEIRLKTDLVTEQIATHFQEHLEVHLEIIEYLRMEWLNQKINTQLEFEKAVLSLIEGFPGFQAINYIDPNGIIRWVNPEAPNIDAKNKDLHDHPFAAETFILAENAGVDCATPVLELWQGELGIAAYFPLIREGHLEGYLNSVFRIHNFIHLYFKHGINQNFYLHLNDGDHDIYPFGEETNDQDHHITSDYPVSVLNREWTLSLSPRPELIATTSYLNQFFFFLSIGLSGFFAFFTRLVIQKRQAVYKSEQKYRDLFEKSDDAVLIISNGRFVDCNQATVRMLRYGKKTELLDTHPSELSPEKQPDGRSSSEKADEMMNIALAKGSHRFEWDHKKADGEVFPVEVLLTAISTREENAIIHTVWRDITERKQAERLQSVVYRISEATHSAKDLSELYDAIHTCLKPVLDVTNFYIAIYDDETELLSFPQYIDEKDTQPVPKPLGRGLTEYIISSGKPGFFNEEGVYELNNQRKIEIIGTLPKQWLGSPLIIRSKVIGVVALQSYDDSSLYTAEDMDILNYVSEQIALAIERKQSITELEVEKTYLDELFINSPEAVALVDNASIILQINPEFTSLFGYTETEIIGQNIDDLLTDGEQIKNAGKLTHEVRAGRRIFADTIRRKKDGTMIPVSVLGSPINYKGGVLAVYAIYRDITERKEAEAHLISSEKKHRRLSEQLLEANNMKETLLDVITHDLKNPAGVIKGFSDILKEEYSDNEIIAAINYSSVSLMNVIDNAVILSQVSLGESIILQELEIIELIRNVAQEFKPLFIHKKMDIELDLPKKQVVKANPIITEVFNNYLSNAIKYASDGKKVIINTSFDEKNFTVHFIDFGPTVPKDKREIIFERSSQLETGEKRGRGLGLAIVKRIAEAHNAEVGVKANEPTGNIFYLTIPV